jgi:hypothetical protein
MHVHVHPAACSWSPRVPLPPPPPFRTGKISVSSRDLSRKIGQIFLERAEVNLHTDLLDTPEVRAV